MLRGAQLAKGSQTLGTSLETGAAAIRVTSKLAK